MTYRLVICTPARCLNPNSRAHWRATAKAKKSLRFEAGAVASKVAPATPLKSASCRATFFVKDKRRRDGDNALSSLKAAFDGLQDAGLIADDSGLIHYPVRFMVDRERAGTVELEISASDSSETT